MKLIDLRPDDRLWDEAWKLYEESFPRKERRSADAHCRTFSDPCFHTKAAVDDDENLLGLLFYWDSGRFIYGEHLAVNPLFRGRGVGSRLVSGFMAAGRGRKMIFEIDPPQDRTSIRRLNFYERLGFAMNDYHYIHPSYRTGEAAEPHRLVLMSYPDALTEDEFSDLKKYIHCRVLAERD